MTTPLTAADFLEAEKYGIAGMAVGIASGAAVELVANLVIDWLELGESKKTSTQLADLLIRVAFASAGLLLGQRLYTMVINTRDPTDGMLFGYGYTIAQDTLYRSAVDLSRKLAGEFTYAPSSLMPPKKSCCGSCAKGGPCNGQKH